MRVLERQYSAPGRQRDAGVHELRRGRMVECGEGAAHRRLAVGKLLCERAAQPALAAFGLVLDAIEQQRRLVGLRAGALTACLALVQALAFAGDAALHAAAVAARLFQCLLRLLLVVRAPRAPCFQPAIERMQAIAAQFQQPRPAATPGRG